VRGARVPRNSLFCQHWISPNHTSKISLLSFIPIALFLQRFRDLQNNFVHSKMSHRETGNGPYLSPNSLPSADNISLFDTSFFPNGQKRLATPAEVRHAGGPKTKMNRPVPISFPSMNLIVKYGFTIKITE
jgi:hypothetical protein